MNSRVTMVTEITSSIRPAGHVTGPVVAFSALFDPVSNESLREPLIDFTSTVIT